MDEKIKTVPLRIEVEVPVDLMKCVEKKLKKGKETLEDIVIEAIQFYGMTEYILYLYEKGLTVDEISLIVGRNKESVYHIVSKTLRLPPYLPKGVVDDGRFPLKDKEGA